MFVLNGNEQQVLWHDSFTDAIGAAIDAAGGIKRVATTLWPGVDPTNAAARLRACLNDDQPHKLDAQEIVHIARLARAAGNHSVMFYLGSELGYMIKAIEPEDESIALDRRIADGLDELNKLLRLRDRKTGLRVAG